MEAYDWFAAEVAPLLEGIDKRFVWDHPGVVRFDTGIGGLHVLCTPFWDGNAGIPVDPQDENGVGGWATDLTFSPRPGHGLPAQAVAHWFVEVMLAWLAAYEPFPVGTEVRLIAFEDEPEQVGVVLETTPERMYVVQVHERYRTGHDDDGVREMHGEQLRNPE